MDRIDLENIVADLTEYYASDKIVGTKTLDLWLKKVRYVDSEAVEFIVDWISTEFDRFPMNMPSKINKAFAAYRDKHGGKVNKREYNCTSEHCSEGWLLVYLQFENVWRETSIRCGECRLHQFVHKDVFMLRADQVASEGMLLRTKDNREMVVAEQRDRAITNQEYVRMNWDNKKREHWQAKQETAIVIPF